MLILQRQINLIKIFFYLQYHNIKKVLVIIVLKIDLIIKIKIV